MTPRELGHLLLRAVLLPLAGAGAAVAGSSLKSFGPAFFSSTIGGIIPAAIVFGGMVLALFGMRFTLDAMFLVVAAAFLTLVFALFSLADTVEKYALYRHGDVTTCLVTEVERRVETHTDSEGRTRTEVYQDHQLECLNPDITEMTTGGRRPAGAVGERIGVAYDPTGRLDPRPAEGAGDYQDKLRTSGIALGAGLALNLAAWLGIGLRRFARLWRRLGDLWDRVPRPRLRGRGRR